MTLRGGMGAGLVAGARRARDAAQKAARRDDILDAAEVRLGGLESVNGEALALQVTGMPAPQVDVSAQAKPAEPSSP